MVRSGVEARAGSANISQARRDVLVLAVDIHKLVLCVKGEARNRAAVGLALADAKRILALEKCMSLSQGVGVIHERWHGHRSADGTCKNKQSFHCRQNVSKDMLWQLELASNVVDVSASRRRTSL